MRRSSVRIRPPQKRFQTSTLLLQGHATAVGFAAEHVAIRTDLRSLRTSSTKVAAVSRPGRFHPTHAGVRYSSAQAAASIRRLWGRRDRIPIMSVDNRPSSVVTIDRRRDETTSRSGVRSIPAPSRARPSQGIVRSPWAGTGARGNVGGLSHGHGNIGVGSSGLGIPPDSSSGSGRADSGTQDPPVVRSPGVARAVDRTGPG